MRWPEFLWYAFEQLFQLQLIIEQQFFVKQLLQLKFLQF